MRRALFSLAFSVAIPNAEARERFSRNFFDEKPEKVEGRREPSEQNRDQ
jgi:hypothetical protein